MKPSVAPNARSSLPAPAPSGRAGRSTRSRARARPLAPREGGKERLKAVIDRSRALLGMPADWQARHRAGLGHRRDRDGDVVAARRAARGRARLGELRPGLGHRRDEAARARRARARAPSTASCPISQRRLRARRDLHLERHHVGRARPERRLDPARPRGPHALRRHLGRLRDGRCPGTSSTSSPGPGRRCWAARRRTACSRSRRAPSRGSRRYTPPWPLPKIFRLTKKGKLTGRLFEGSTINTPSMLCVEDALDGLAWAERDGGLAGLIARSEANLAAIARLGRAHAVGRLPRARSRDALLHLDLPPDRRPLVRGAGRPRRAARRSRSWSRCSRRKASRSTSRAIATRRRACASGAAPPSSARTSRRCCPGSTGPGPRCAAGHRRRRLPRRRPSFYDASDAARRLLVPLAHTHALFGPRFARHLARLTRLYWTSPDAPKGGLLLAATVALELGTVYGNVLLADVAAPDLRRAPGQADGGRSSRPSALFLGVVLGFVFVSTYRIYLRQALEIRWRRWLTDHFLERVDELARLLPDRAAPRGDRQPGPAHRRGRARLRGERARPLALAALGGRDAASPSAALLWSAVGQLAVPGRRQPTSRSRAS